MTKQIEKKNDRARIDFSYPERDYCLVEEKELKSLAESMGIEDFLSDEVLQEYVYQEINADVDTITGCDFPY